MIQKIRRFRRGQKQGTMLRQLNQLVDGLNDLATLTGDGLVQVNKVKGAGYTFSLNLEGVRSRIGRPRVLRFAQVVGIFNKDNDAWQEVDGYQSHVTAYSCDADGDHLGSEILYIKCSMAEAIALPLTGDHGNLGTLALAVGDIIGYLAGDDKEGVAGASELHYDGYKVHDAGSGRTWLNHE